MIKVVFNKITLEEVHRIYESRDTEKRSVRELYDPCTSIR